MSSPPFGSERSGMSGTMLANPPLVVAFLLVIVLLLTKMVAMIEDEENNQLLLPLLRLSLLTVEEREPFVVAMEDFLTMAHQENEQTRTMTGIVHVYVFMMTSLVHLVTTPSYC